MHDLKILAARLFKDLANDLRKLFRSFAYRKRL